MRPYRISRRDFLYTLSAAAVSASAGCSNVRPSLTVPPRPSYDGLDSDSYLSALTVVIFEPLTWVLAGTVLLVALVFESVLAGATWPRFSVRPDGRPGVWLACGLSVVWLTGQGIHVWADATAYAPVTSFTRALPLYFPMKAKRILTRLGLLDPAAMEQRRLMRQASARLASPRQFTSCVFT